MHVHVGANVLLNQLNVCYILLCRGYWIADLQWSYDDLFVVCVTEQGGVCVLTRMGEPLLIRTVGHSMDMGPRLYLPVHPLIIVQ